MYMVWYSFVFCFVALWVFFSVLLSWEISTLLALYINIFIQSISARKVIYTDTDSISCSNAVFPHPVFILICHNHKRKMMQMFKCDKEAGLSFNRSCQTAHVCIKVLNILIRNLCRLLLFIFCDIRMTKVDKAPSLLLVSACIMWTK